MKLKTRRSEEALSDIKSVAIAMENGKILMFNIHEELFIPVDADGIRKEASLAPSRYAFWAYQVERAFHRLREVEDEVRRSEGRTDLIYRKGLTFEFGEYREGEVKSFVSVDGTLMKARRKLAGMKEHVGILQAVKEAHDHRCKILTRLVSRLLDERS